MRLSISLALPAPCDERGVILVDGHFLGAAQVLQSSAFSSLSAKILSDRLSTRERGNIFQHGLAAISKARGFHGRTLQCSAKLVHHQCAPALRHQRLRR